MLKPTPKALAAAANALYRIRAVEGPIGSDGRKTVWHQCALGAELVSTVNERGHVLRQELTLLDGYFLWSTERGLQTGAVEDEGPKAVVNAGPVIELDGEVSAERLDRALEAFSGYAGNDRYIQHLVHVMELTRDGLPATEEDTVTSVSPLEVQKARSRRRLWMVAGVALTVAAVVAAAAVALR